MFITFKNLSKKFVNKNKFLSLNNNLFIYEYKNNIFNF